MAELSRLMHHNFDRETFDVDGLFFFEFYRLKDVKVAVAREELLRLQRHSHDAMLNEGFTSLSRLWKKELPEETRYSHVPSSLKPRYSQITTLEIVFNNERKHHDFHLSTTCAEESYGIVIRPGLNSTDKKLRAVLSAIKSFRPGYASIQSP